MTTAEPRLYTIPPSPPTSAPGKQNLLADLFTTGEKNQAWQTPQPTPTSLNNGLYRAPLPATLASVIQTYGNTTSHLMMTIDRE